MDAPRAVLVVGMHRSGTSAVAGALAALGVHFGSDLLPPAPENPKGFFEHRRLLALHNQLLGAFGSSWSDPRPLPPGWLADPRTARVRARIREVLEADLLHAPVFGVKDPRLCRLAPLWPSLLGEVGVPFQVVFIARPPHEVAASLAARNGFGLQRGLALWLGHVLAAERGTRGTERTIVLYPDLVAHRDPELCRLGRALSLPAGGSTGERARSFLAPSLHHHRTPPRGAEAAGLSDARRADDIWRALSAWRRSGAPPAGAFDAAQSGA